jgi:hypothetical protein
VCSTCAIRCAADRSRQCALRDSNPVSQLPRGPLAGLGGRAEGERKVPPAGLQPATFRLKAGCSQRLSYGGELSLAAPCGCEVALVSSPVAPPMDAGVSLQIVSDERACPDLPRQLCPLTLPSVQVSSSLEVRPEALSAPPLPAGLGMAVEGGPWEEASAIPASPGGLGPRLLGGTRRLWINGLRPAAGHVANPNAC